MQTTVTPEWECEVRKRMKILGVKNYTVLAEMAGYSESTVRKYMCGCYTNDNPRMGIEQALGMR